MAVALLHAVHASDIMCSFTITHEESPSKLSYNNLIKDRNYASNLLTLTEGMIDTEDEYWHASAVCSDMDKHLHSTTSMTCNESYKSFTFKTKFASKKEIKNFELKYGFITTYVSDVELKKKLVMNSKASNCTIYLESVKRLGILLSILGLITIF